MERPLLIFGILSALCWGILIYVITRTYADTIEEVNDPAWACTALGKGELKGINGETIGNVAKGDSLHLLAAASNKPELVMVQTAKGERGWVENAILPHYYQIHSIAIDEAASFHKETFNDKIIGQDLETLEKKYTAALQIIPKKKTKKNPNEDGFSAVFPMRVLTKGSKTVSQYATVQFQEGKAVSVETDSVYQKKASRAKIDPLIFVFLDKGFCVKAPQKAFPAYTSFLPTGVDGKKKVDSWAERIGLFLLLIIGLILLAVFPILLVSPLVVLVYQHTEDQFYRFLIAIPLMLAAIAVFFAVYSIVSASVSLLLLIVNIAALVVMLFLCTSLIY
ncbi:MAG: hypothetical protein J6P73_02740 [Bacteroidales bacterium]|nr:hypothetical protein [Bacteroidales bacterium]